MAFFEHREATLLRILEALFGRGSVVPHMSVAAVCGKELDEYPLEHWARKERCLFTVVDHNDDARMVIEFIGDEKDDADIIDIYAMERQSKMIPLLAAAHIRYVALSPADYEDLTHPAADREFIVQFFHEKCGLIPESSAGVDEVE